jgi:hypothetical protein
VFWVIRLNLPQNRIIPTRAIIRKTLEIIEFLNLLNITVTHFLLRQIV